jgi:hypothetical protein
MQGYLLSVFVSVRAYQYVKTCDISHYTTSAKTNTGSFINHQQPLPSPPEVSRIRNGTGNALQTMNKNRSSYPVLNNNSTATTTAIAAVVAEEIDQRTLLLIRRVLCAHSPPSTPLDELLPALSSSTEVDIQLYAFIAIIARDYILSWYGKISNDHAFIDEIVALIAHCTRSLEERLRKVGLLVFVCL